MSRLSMRAILGDITLQDTDAIVNAANTSLLGGGGVDGAIHRAAGKGLLDECRRLGGCPAGEARITGAYNLKCRYVIHTPGPVYRGGSLGEEAILKSSYVNSMNLVMRHSLRSVSFPAISTGVYAYPKAEACDIAIETVAGFILENNYDVEVYFVLFDRESYGLYLEKLKSVM